MRFAYADPPYIGQAKRHYKCAEVDHAQLVQRLYRDFPDGWALSCSTPTLRQILLICHNLAWDSGLRKPEDAVRIGAWCKSFCAFKRNVRPAYAWEPVIFWRGRNPTNGHRAAIPEKNGKQTTPKDFHVAPITLKKGLMGAKPESVCRWILDLLNAQPGDEIADLFPGTGVMGRIAAQVCSYPARASVGGDGDRNRHYPAGEQANVDQCTHGNALKNPSARVGSEAAADSCCSLAGPATDAAEERI